MVEPGADTSTPREPRPANGPFAGRPAENPRFSSGERARDFRRALLVTAILLALLLVPFPRFDGTGDGFGFPLDLALALAAALADLLPAQIDKLVHALFFAIESHFLHRAARHFGRRPRSFRPALIAALVATFGVGVGSELLQGLVPTRAADPLDLLANGLGAAAWLAFFWFVRGRNRPTPLVPH